MTTLPHHAETNRAVWTRLAPEWVEPGRKSWESPHIHWGIWGIPESRVGAFGDLGWLRGKDTIELGCGTAYFSAWMHKLGARPVGIDVTPAQLETARALQKEFGIEFPLLEGNAEQVPYPDASFDLAFSEYGASIWCEPDAWISEASRLLRPGGVLVFLRNSNLSMLCSPDTGPISETLQRAYFGMRTLAFEPDHAIEFQIPMGEMVRLLRRTGFEIEDLIELQAPADAPETRFDYMKKAWAQRWPSEEIWRARKK